MSRRRPPPEELDEDDEEEDEDEEDPDDPVEYFVDVVLEDCVRTSVPNWAQSEQTSISAPSTLTVVGDAVSAPHISHCGIGGLCHGAQ